MGTTIRPEVSAKNKYWIERHRFYELKHFCMQYQGWKRAYALCDGYRDKPNESGIVSNVGEVNPTENYAAMALSYANRIEMVERAAAMTDVNIGPFILKGVTTGISYEILRANFDVPCGKDVYYEMYRRFFYILDRLRQ